MLMAKASDGSDIGLIDPKTTELDLVRTSLPRFFETHKTGNHGLYRGQLISFFEDRVLVHLYCPKGLASGKGCEKDISKSNVFLVLDVRFPSVVKNTSMSQNLTVRASALATKTVDFYLEEAKPEQTNELTYHRNYHNLGFPVADQDGPYPLVRGM